MTDTADTLPLINICTIAISFIAIVVSIYAARQSRNDTLYQDLDALYLEILKLGMANPRFVNPDYTLNYKVAFQGDELHKYQTYAYMVWNVCESIVDRREDKKLFATWKPVLDVEYRRHHAWLNAAENHHRFKTEFMTYIQTELKLQN